MNWLDFLSPLKIISDSLKNWKKQEIIHISPLKDIENEEIYKKLSSEGYEFCWPKESKIRHLKNDGWKIVTEKHIFSKNKIFMDRNEELTLMCRRTPDPSLRSM